MARMIFGRRLRDVPVVSGRTGQEVIEVVVG